jgi:hypothetical protein
VSGCRPVRGRGTAVPAAVLLMLATPGVVRAETARPWYETFTLDGFFSTHYEHNFNRPASRLNAYRVFDGADQTFVWDVGELSAQRLPEKASDVGFRVDVTAGGSIPKVTASSGLLRSESGEAEGLDIQQAYASYLAPLGRGLRIDLGKHCTHLGYEVIEGYDGYNDNATRSFLFGYAIPFTHTGLRLTYPFSERFSAQAYLVNGWDEVEDNNSGKTVGFQLALTPSGFVTLTLNGISGPEQANDNRDRRDVGEVVLVSKITEKLGLGLNYDYGHERNALGPGRDAVWTGAAAYARYGIGERAGIALRAEEFQDRDGARTGTAQTLREVTLTPEFKVSDAFVVRADLRYDWSSEKTFEKRQSVTDTQPTVLLNLIWVY